MDLFALNYHVSHKRKWGWKKFTYASLDTTTGKIEKAPIWCRNYNELTQVISMCNRNKAFGPNYEIVHNRDTIKIPPSKYNIGDEVSYNIVKMLEGISMHGLIKGYIKNITGKAIFDHNNGTFKDFEYFYTVAKTMQHETTILHEECKLTLINRGNVEKSKFVIGDKVMVQKTTWYDDIKMQGTFEGYIVSTTIGRNHSNTTNEYTHVISYEIGATNQSIKAKEQDIKLCVSNDDVVAGLPVE